MAATPLKAGGFLQYNSDFQVLICRECQYAIQKSAIDSHLRKHKIYRRDRQKLLAEIAQLELLEPEDVIQPTSGSSPIDDLPVFQGYRCKVAACRHLTASEKRMKRHWSEVHGRGESIPRLHEFTCVVSLQTFFRGTKVKYFEVSSSADDLANGTEDEYSVQYTRQVESDNGSHPERTPIAGTTAGLSQSPQPAQISTPSKSVNTQSSMKVDLETLKFFHHFVTITAPTLPGSLDYWQMKAPSEALQHSGVMYGLLAIAACHMTVLATDSLSRRFYSERQTMLSGDFFYALSPETGSMAEEQISESKTQSRQLINQVMSLLRCAQWAAAETSIKQAVINPPNIGVILDAIRGGIIPEPALSLNDVQRAASQNNQNCAAQLSFDGDSDSTRDLTLSVLLTHLRGLPLRMAETLKKPNSAQDLFETISAIDALVECCDISFASDESRTVLRAAVAWLAKIQAHFDAIITRHDPGAMVVLAHWAAILVKRAEQVGCWFLRDAPKSILLQIANQLSATNPEALPLVESLLGNLNG